MNKKTMEVINNKNVGTNSVPAFYKVADAEPAEPPVTTGTGSSTPSTNTTSPAKVRNDADDYDYTYGYNLEGILEKFTYVKLNKKLTYFNNGVKVLSKDDDNASASAENKGKVRETSSSSQNNSQYAKYGNSAEPTTLMDKLQLYTLTRNINGQCPPGYYDNIIYPHRAELYKAVSGNNGDADRLLRIGDCVFVIPPEFITVNTRTTKESIQGLRQSGSIQTKHGYSTKEIQISLVLNGIEQINGYKVDSPFDKPYYVDGLRPLISQFKYTPFVPVQNTFLNNIHGVYNVALRNISVETIQGFPETLNVILTMQEFNSECYTEIPEVMLDDCIDWDLFRWYVQRPLTDDSPRCEFRKIFSRTENKEAVTGDFEIKLLKDDIFSGYKLDMDGNPVLDEKGEPIELKDSELKYMTIDITQDKFYRTMVSNKDNVELTDFTFNVSNIMPSIQLSAHETPTLQFLGTTDSTFTLAFETTDPSVVSTFNSINKENQTLVRENREKNGIGFIKIENELIRLTGTEFMILENINISTVPQYPGLYKIFLECVSYDANARDKEKLIPILGIEKLNNNNEWSIPQGTERANLISQEADGIGNKINQEMRVMQRLREIEMYPDLKLPTYKEVDEALAKIIEFRVRNNMIQKPLTNIYPRYGYETDYFSGYVNPDFYIFYPTKLSDIENDFTNKKSDNKENRSAKAKIGSELLENGKAKAESVEAVKKNILSKITSGSFKLGDVFDFNSVKPDVAVSPEYAYGYEPGVLARVHRSFLLKDKKKNTSSSSSTTGGAGNSNYVPGSGQGGDPTKDPVSVNKRFGNPFVDLICDRADSGCGYVYGSDGQIYTKEMKTRLENTYPYSYYNGEGETSQWLGKQVFDCSGIISWAMRKIGLKGSGFREVSGNFGNHGTPVSPSNIRVGDVFYNSVHCGVYIGDGKTVEAMDSIPGVCYGTFKSSYNVVRLNGLAEANETFLANNPNFYKTSTSKTSSSSSGGGTLKNETRTVSTNTDMSTSTYAPASEEFTHPRDVYNNNQKAEQCVLANFGNGDLCDRWNDLILKNAKLFGLDPNFIKCIIKIESGGDPNVVSAYDPPNIVGLMQIYTTFHSSKFKGNNYYDPDDNIYVGCKIFKDYGAGWVNHDLERWLACYNAGPGNAKKIFIDKTMAMPFETANYIAKYRKYYAQLKANGAYSAGLLTPVDGGMSSTIIPSIGEEDSNPEDYEYNYTPGDFRNPNAGKVYGDLISEWNMSKFGEFAKIKVCEPFYDYPDNSGLKFDVNEISKATENNISHSDYSEHMFHDMVKYSYKGSLVRAFPSYLFVILDEQSSFIDGEKLWTNYYVYRSVIDINVYSDKDTPISTAKVTLTNFSDNLTNVKRSYSTSDLLDDGVVKWVYDLTGALVNEEITDEMIKIKSKPQEQIKLHMGARIHIRLGYGSDVERYPICFNGTVTNVQHGDLVTLVAQSDGVELTTNPITDKTNSTNKDIGLPEESSNMIANILCARESDFLNGVSFGNWKLTSKYGIEHFGMYHDGIDVDGLLHVNEFDVTASASSKQYDLNKNIYQGTYEAVPYCYFDINPFDGESNWRFHAYGKTVWDVLKMNDKSLSEFIAYPRPFMFDHRLFYGVGNWLYKYEYIAQDNILYEKAKTFIQVHIASSLDSIIDNQIIVDTSYLYTNMIGIYVSTDDLASTPVIMSDYKIDWDKQRTKTIDTTATQDYGLIPDFLESILHWAGKFDNGKDMAISMCISELCTSWNQTYTGTLLMLGRPEINVYDWVHIDDVSLRMEGTVDVRQVVHSLSIETGFTTSIVPGLLAFNTKKQSGLINTYRSAAKLAIDVAVFYRTKLTGLNTIRRVSKVISAAKSVTYLTGLTTKVAAFTLTNGKKIWDGIKTAKCVTNAIDFAKDIKIVANVAQSIPKIWSGAKTAFTAGATATTGVVGLLASLAISAVVDLCLGFAFESIIDMFAYKNTVVVMPMMIHNPDGSMKAFVGGVTGGKHILPAANQTETTEDT